MVIAFVLLLSQSVAGPTSELRTVEPQVLSASANVLPSAPSANLMPARPLTPKAPEAPVVALIRPVQRGKSAKLPPAASKRLWLALSLVQHSAASFDAWTTRRKLQSGGYHENNPLLKPFASNSSLYVAVQTTPLAFDYIANRMRNSNRRWLRRLWWVPQAAQTGTHLTCGAMNLAK